MNKARKHLAITTLAVSLFPVISLGQVPDLLNAFDTGGRAMGIGGSTAVTDSNTQSALDNPAGLAYVTEPTVALNMRNLPESSTIASGVFTSRTNSTSQSVGRMGLTHVGYATPFKNGTLGFSYSIGGYTNNSTVGNNLSFNTLTVRNLQEINRLQTDFFTVSYGQQSGSQNIGFGIVVANQYVRSTQQYDLFDGNTNVGSVDTDQSGTGIGVGGVLGVQGPLPGQDNVVWGASLRSPISIGGNSVVSSHYKTIPGKASIGFAGRADQFSNGQDFLVWGVQGNYYFGGRGTGVYPRKNVFGFGVGIEYNLHQFNARIPIRIGYAYIPAGGAGFDDRNSLTFGIGYRPFGDDFTVDLNFAKPTGGSSFDMALGITYRPSN